MFALILLAAIVQLVACSYTPEQVGLFTRLGQVAGVSTDVNGKTVHRFLGIPYGKAPVGELRLAKPQAYGQFKGGVLDATNFGNKCLQYEDGKQVGTEDCLFLNIFAPSSASGKLKSVMIWIYGGGFMFGTTNDYPGDVLVASEDILVVTINYRVNVFGFLSTGDARVPGNFGLWDQRLAIQWVKDNIADYGGDPNSMTLFGESAGGRSTSFQMLSPLNSPDLFQRVIVESGSAFSLTYINRNPMAEFKLFCETLGCFVDENLMNCLRDKPAELLLQASANVTRPYPFFPVVDGEFLPHDLGFLLNNFTETGDASNFANMASFDLLGGWNDQDGLYFYSDFEKFVKISTGETRSENVSEEILKVALSVLPFSNYPAKDLVVNTFANFYRSKLNSQMSNLTQEQWRIKIFTEIAGDVVFKVPIVLLLRMHSAVSSKNTFAYEFRRKRSKRTQVLPSPDWLRTGANHVDEISYVFGFPLAPKWLDDDLETLYKCIDCTAEDRQLSMKMMRQWANFARIGHPGSDFDNFKYPQKQVYTTLNAGSFGQEVNLLDEETRLWSAIDAAVAKTNSHVETTSQGVILFGKVALTANQIEVVVIAMSLSIALLLFVCGLQNKANSSADRKRK